MDRNSVSLSHAGFVAIAGEANVGKSTFLNTVLGQKLSIVSRKPQTTRKEIVGIYSDTDSSGVPYQIIFLDAPGVLLPKTLLHEKMLFQFDKSVSNADVVLLLVDTEKYVKNRRALATDLAFQRVRHSSKPVLLGLNKVDAVNKDDIFSIAHESSTLFPFEEIFPLSAKTGYNVPSVLESLKVRLPSSDFLYDPEDISSMPERFFVTELIREKVLELYSKEVPYSIEVIVENFSESEHNKLLIQATIVVQKDSQKAIMIGNQGQAIKRLGILSRKEIELFLQRKVYLSLFVKVRQAWQKNRSMLKEFGY